MRTAAAGACALLFATSCHEGPAAPRAIAGADPGRGRQVIEQVACGACHVIPGVSWPQGRVGPGLEGFADRALIGGRFPNEPNVLVAWVRNAPALAPETGMPPIPMTEQEARDVAAYLYALDAR